MTGLDPSQLPGLVRAATAHAEGTGALQPIATSSAQVEDGGIPFDVRVVDSLQRKSAVWVPPDPSVPRPNPFLPHDPDLFVADVSDTHVCLLNKFKVLEHHMLIVTREFAEQTSVLDEADLAALWACMEGVDGLGFYNGGEEAGASQPHKHLQLAPYPLGDGIDRPPLEAVLDDAEFAGRLGVLPAFPFVHTLARLEPGTGPRDLLDTYLALLTAIDLPPLPDGSQAGPYNLCLTREWMLAVPRSREYHGRISINSIGYAGGLLVKDEAELEVVREVGPMEILGSVGVDR
jgi:sulfate adenylyltransferase (ADP) / ATP adenylyltransferase